MTAALRRLREEGPRQSVVVIAKSLGSSAAALVAERGLPAVWLTPVLTDDSAVESTAAGPAPALLIGGSAGRLWVPAAAEATGKQTLTPRCWRFWVPAMGEFLDPLMPVRSVNH
ncbi:MAG TPA: hypothetical protein VES42_26210 [Pilimelia sp.]|nr:hypothetical protein [Pilimelia sp.]